MASLPHSTPSKSGAASTKYNYSDENLSQPPSNQSQDLLKAAVGNELDDHTWEFKAEKFAKMLSRKIRKTPLKAHEVDTLDDYEIFAIDNVNTNDVSTPSFPTSTSEREHYPPLRDFLNECVAVCLKSLGKEKKYYDDLKFVVWDCEMKDGVAGAAALKPDIAGVKGLQDRDTIKAAGLYWRPPKLSDYGLLIPVEVKSGWPDLVRQAGTYARCLFDANPLRQFAMVLAYNHIDRGLRFLVFHHGGLSSSVKLEHTSETGRRDILRIFLAILSWETPAHAGLPMWCNDGEMFLPNNDHVGVEKVLHNSLCIRGRAPRVVLVCARDTLKGTVVPPAENTCLVIPRRSDRLRNKEELQTVAEDVDHGGSGSRSKRTKAIASESRSRGSKTDGPQSKPKIKTIDVSIPKDGPKTDNAKAPALIVIPRHNSHIQAIKHILQENGKVLSKTLPGTVVKFSWASLTTRSIEPDLLRDCSGLFGTLKHYYSFLVCHGDDSPATNHLFLPAPGDDRQSLHWPLFVQNSTPPEPDYRALWGYASAYSGHSLMTASSSKELILAIFHASLGWFNMIQKGYHHRDLSIGNILMIDEAVKTKRFEIIKKQKESATVEDITKKLQQLKINIDPSATWELSLEATLQRLEITDECRGFVIDGDMAIKMADYFEKEHNGSRSGTYEFMSDDLLLATELGDPYLQSPVDDLFALYYTMQWAAVFHHRGPAAGKDIPPRLHALRKDVSASGPHRDRATNVITQSAKLDSRQYGQFLVDCHPFLRHWHSSLLSLRDNWKESQFQLEGQDSAGVYPSLFPIFAVQGVAQLAELVAQYTM